MHILVTGFTAFGSHAVNRTEALALAIPEVLHLEGGIHTVDVMVLDVTFQGATTVSSLVEGGSTWDLILHFGLCDSCDVLRIERIARNELRMRIPDNDGRQVLESRIDDSGPIGTILDVTDFSSKIPFEYSFNAGGFICNETYFHTLRALEFQSLKSFSLPPPCLFIHVPPEDKLSDADLHEFVNDLVDWVCGYLKQNSINVVAGAIIQHHQVLLGERSPTQTQPNTWEFPGGKIEEDESWPMAVKREWLEEFDVQVTPLHLLGCLQHTVDRRLIRVYPVACLPTNVNTEFKLKVHSNFAWMSVGSDPCLEWTGRDDEIFSLIQSIL